MDGRSRPESIENDWGLLYRDYADVYDRFAAVPKAPTWSEVVCERFDLSGKRVLDVGTGSGRSIARLVPHAGEVIGLDVEAAMLAVARTNLVGGGLEGVRLVAGDSAQLPLAADSIDVVTAITLASLYYYEPTVAFCREAERVTRPGGVVITVNIAPRWYGGELAEVVLGMPRSEMQPTEREAALVDCGFEWLDYFSDADYGSVENTVATYGFIFGKRVIAHIRENGIQRVRWKTRVHFKRMPGAGAGETDKVLGDPSGVPSGW